MSVLGVLKAGDADVASGMAAVSDVSGLGAEGI